MFCIEIIRRAGKICILVSDCKYRLMSGYWEMNDIYKNVLFISS